MNAFRKNVTGFVVREASDDDSARGIFSTYQTAAGSVRVMDKKTFDAAIVASNKLIRETVSELRSGNDKLTVNGRKSR